MESSERLSRLNMLVFKRSNLKTLRDATNSLFDIFHDILEKDFEYGAYFTPKEILQRLQDVDQKYWKEIRNLYLHEEYYGYNDGNFSDDELNNPAKIMMDILSGLCKCKEGIYQKIEQKIKELEELKVQNNELRDKTTELYQQLLDEKRENADRKMEFVKLSTQNVLMETLLEEKKNKITELMKDKNVQLSGKEKEKILENANKKIEELEEEVMELKASKQRYTRRMSTVDDQNKMLKLKQEMLGNTDLDGETGSEEVQQLKREIYVKDKDIAHLEDQFYQEQRVMLGMVGGIKTDVNILSETFYREEEAIRDPVFVKLTKTIDKIYNGASEGKLASVRMMLPPHYTCYDQDLKVKKLRRLSKAASLPKIPPIISENKPILPVIGQSVGTTPIGSTNGTMTSIPEKNETKSENVSSNPVIVDPKTNTLKSFTYLQHFPHMAQNFILDHWKKFKDYDSDHDLTLDLPEVAAILKSLGCKFTPDQIEEALDEVDRDHSHTLDFFEYLLVVDKIMKKSGKSKLFKAGLTKQNQEVSKACVIQ